MACLNSFAPPRRRAPNSRSNVRASASAGSSYKFASAKSPPLDEPRRLTIRPAWAECESAAGSVVSAAFSPDGGRVVTASVDKTARLWPHFSNTRHLVKSVAASVPLHSTSDQRVRYRQPAE